MTGVLGRADQWERASSLVSLPSFSSSRLFFFFFKCPVTDGDKLSLCYLSVRDEVPENKWRCSKKEHILRWFLFIYCLSEGGIWGAGDESDTFWCCAPLSVTTTWREALVLVGVDCVKVKLKTKIINNFLFCFCIKNMLAVKPISCGFVDIKA